ncbi:hypothetical protein RFI_22160, partial [Reticulomyxa filosa]
DASANDENEALIVRILDQFLQNETNRLHWIRLLVDPDINSNSMLSELLKKSFKDWLNEDKKEGQPFHSKVIELLSSPTFQNDSDIANCGQTMISGQMIKLKGFNNIMELWVFLDEVNTSPDIGWFKELIYDHSLDGVKISNQIKVIAACNPYRPRKIENDENVNINDPLSKWVYRVFPLCETMKEYVWHFGQLSQLDEKQYIQAMARQLKEKFDKQKYIVASQQFLRKHLKNEFIVSLRDVSRCLKFFHWLMQQPQTDKPVEWTERALKIALGLCYYFRLDKRKRKEYDTMMLERNQCSFVKVLNEEIDNLSKPFEIQRSVVKHNILKENLFVLFFCIATVTPIILIGKPGTPKTLSLYFCILIYPRNIKYFNDSYNIIQIAN